MIPHFCFPGKKMPQKKSVAALAFVEIQRARRAGDNVGHPHSLTPYFLCKTLSTEKYNRNVSKKNSSKKNLLRLSHLSKFKASGVPLIM